MKRSLIVLFISQMSMLASAQSGYYFQQEVNYKIDVTLNDKTHSLSAYEEFEYINNSAQELDYLLIHLWPNAYKNAKTAMSQQKFKQGDFFMLWAKPTAKGFIDSLDFKIDGLPAKWEYLKDFEDIAILYLNEPLAAGGRIKVTTPFYVKLPSGSISRLGHIGESYQITQWYPKPAVFDKDGWHEMPYLTQGEFFSEFGSFDVSITLPANYVVGATGDLQTESERAWMNELAGKPLPSETLFAKTNEDSTYPKSSDEMKTLRFIQSKVHDFGWFADKRWIVRKGEVELPHTKKKVTTWALFTSDNAEIWSKTGIQSINDALYHYSLWTGDYPYNVCTAVDGTISAGGGMEYPNVTVIGSTQSTSNLSTVIIHEVGHNWFYGILGSNERDNAWMDEGINSFFETRTILATSKNPNAIEMMGGGLNLSKIFGLDKFSYQYLSEELLYLISARGSKDQPIQAPSEYYTEMNYGAIVYKKTALAFNYLMNYLGEEKFNECMRVYFETWKFRHPTPDDIKLVFETTTGKNLSWFFGDLIYTKGHIDYKAISIRFKSGTSTLTVKNDGDIGGPFSVDIIRDGQLADRKWYDGISPLEKQSLKIDARKGDHIKINNVQGIPEYNRNNNTIRTKGILRRSEPYTLKPITGIDDPGTSQLFWTPLIGWNNYNKWMLGIQLHNRTIPAKNYQWSLAPMYSIATKTMNGFARVEYNNGRIGVGVRGQRFAVSTFPYDDKKFVRSYDLISPFINVMLFPDRLQKDWRGNVDVSFFSIGELLKNDNSRFIGDYDQIYPDYGKGPRISHLRIRTNLIKKMLRSEFRLQSTFEGGEYTNWSVFQQHTMMFDYIYRGKGKKKIKTRLYYGGGDGFYLNAAGQYGGSRYDSNSPKNRIASDYVYDGLFLGRSDVTGIFSQQFLRTQGGLAAPTQQSANKSLTSLNVEMDAPVKLPISLYGGVAILKNIMEKEAAVGSEIAANITNTKTRFLWNTGISIPVAPGILQIYIPLLYSTNIRDELKARDVKFPRTIMFDLNLNLMNPMELINNIGN